MPGFDGTGPQGLGSMSGGGFGVCTGYAQAGNLTPRGGRGFAGRRAPGLGGRGRGRMNMYHATGVAGWNRYSTPRQAATPQQTQPTQQTTKSQELQSLQKQASILQQQLSQITERIEELGK